MTAPMPETMSPREKVAALKTNDPTNPAHRLASDLQAGHFAFGEARDDLIEVLSNLPRYAALASSGDHAELARLAEDPAMDFGGFGRSRVLALIAEVAALREQLDWMTRDRNAVIVERDRADTMMQSAEARATEAERKLAEAVEVIRDVDRAARQAASMNDAGYTVTVDRTATHIYGITNSFLSKEVERG